MFVFRKTLLLFCNILLIFYFIYRYHGERLVRVSFAFPYETCRILGDGTVRSLAQSSDLKSSSAIAILTGNNFKQIAVCLSSIDKHLIDNHESHVIIFHTGYPFSYDISNVLRSTKRHVMFRNVDREFSSFPKGFDPYSSEPSWSKRGKWNYHHMIRFWFKLVLEIPEVQQYDYIMRLDDDSQLLGTWFNVFTMMREKNSVYFANDELVDYEDGIPGTLKLKDICFTYKEKNNIPLEDSGKFERAFLENGIRTYSNNFEIMNTHFFRRTDVLNWTEMIDATHGIYKHRWGDAVLRYLTLTIFAKSEHIMHRESYNLPYCHPC